MAAARGRHWAHLYTGLLITRRLVPAYIIRPEPTVLVGQGGRGGLRQRSKLRQFVLHGSQLQQQRLILLNELVQDVVGGPDAGDHLDPRGEYGDLPGREEVSETPNTGRG